jgi:hypothetical protein
MLAYVFWHQPQSGVTTSSYQSALRAFHEALDRADIRGFHGSTVFSILDAPWLESPGRGYEEWYLLDGSHALDQLNEAAVSPAVKDFHDRAAAAAGDGKAGLYRLRAGIPTLEQAAFATWMTRPATVDYEDFDARIGRWASHEHVSLWGRQMVLGPTPEFCLLSRDDPDVPHDLVDWACVCDLVWP